MAGCYNSNQDCYSSVCLTSWEMLSLDPSKSWISPLQTYIDIHNNIIIIILDVAIKISR